MQRRLAARRVRLFSGPVLTVADAKEGVRMWRLDAELVSVKG